MVRMKNKWKLKAIGQATDAAEARSCIERTKKRKEEAQSS